MRVFLKRDAGSILVESRTPVCGSARLPRRVYWRVPTADRKKPGVTLPHKRATLVPRLGAIGAGRVIFVHATRAGNGGPIKLGVPLFRAGGVKVDELHKSCGLNATRTPSLRTDYVSPCFRIFIP